MLYNIYRFSKCNGRVGKNGDNETKLHDWIFFSELSVDPWKKINIPGKKTEIDIIIVNNMVPKIVEASVESAYRHLKVGDLFMRLALDKMLWLYES